MFEKLKEAFSKFTSSVKERIETKELKPDDVNEPLEEFIIDLVEAGVAYDAALVIADGVRRSLAGSRVLRTADVDELVKDAVLGSIVSALGVPGPDLVAEARRKCSESKPYVIAFFGVNGVGKTTTIAKVAKYLMDHGVRPLIAAADTFRAGAQEQLKTHAERLGVTFVGGSYGSDPASVAYNAIATAQKRGACAILLDTAGRMHVDVDLMSELKKIVRVAKPDLKVLVVDSLTGNDSVEQARLFNDGVGVDAVIVTKVDADIKGGTVVSVAAAIRKPVIFIGVGQGYEDLEKIDPQDFAKKLLSCQVTLS
ncbi:MAG: signal recognition particle-docking protein FtsY [Acidilobus sp.]